MTKMTQLFIGWVIQAVKKVRTDFFDSLNHA